MCEVANMTHPTTEFHQAAPTQLNESKQKKKTLSKLHAAALLPEKLFLHVLLEQIFGTSPRWSEPIRTESILCPLTLLGKPDELRATEKVMTSALLRAGLIIKAASVGIGPRVSGSALQSSNTSGTPPTHPTPLSATGKG